MLKVTWRNLLARKVRLMLSGFAIVLGVAFVAGTMIFTDAMGGAFDDIIEGSTADVEIGFAGAGDFDSAQDNRTMPASVVDDLEALPEVESVHPQNALQSIYIIGENGKVVGGNGPPGLAFNPTTATSLTGKPILVTAEGELPDGPNEVAIDVDAAEKAGYEVGDTVTLATSGTPPTMKVKLTGLVEFGSGGLNGATLTVFDTKFLQDTFFGGKDVYTSISLNAADGVSQEELAAAAQEVLPKDVVARTGDESVKKNKASLDEIMGFLKTFLLVFAGVALVVGIFLIINTFSILVAQRSRELALLRALGASRGQVNRSVITEALVVGLVGSTVGLGLGYLLALLLRFLFGRFGLDLGGAEFPVSGWTIFWSYAVGLVVTTIAAVLPAVRASRIPPMAALRDDVALPEATLRKRMIAGAVLVVLGAGGMIGGLAGSGTTGLVLIGAGILFILIGVALMSALLGRPLLSLFAVAYRRIFGSVGNLAAQNTLRNPRRTGATASALMIGLALMSMMSIFGSSASASTDATIGKSLTSQFIVSNAVGQPFSPDVARQIRKLPTVAGVAALRQAFPKVDGKVVYAVAVKAEDLRFAFRVPVASGSLDDLQPGTVAISANQAENLGLDIGDPVTLEFQAGEVTLKVVATFLDGGVVPGNYMVTPDTFVKGGMVPLDSMVFVTKKDDAETADLEAGIERITEDLPTVTVKDPEGFADEQKTQINQFLYMIYGLLGLSVIIAILGVVNTLSLSVIERTREVGLLRAVGLSRRQLRTMIRLESVVVAVFGALLGMVMGVVFGSTLVWALEDQGLTELSIPWGMLAIFVLASAVLGVLAAVFPARRAARLDVLKAIATE
ncbi:FtsX-like permease family protein [Nocardioides sp. JQ2195]|uniref:ABC transporter permease n=1 Tax=Nocardioides sp. JQ2195 TaxID=2592334 RepID=UPI00143EF432|nr:FtsX-like permease family protein [Nocardioides sp. JQ2195]QIX25726.1 FtsX-like permease family protein [Nocardioides sp. JQ2195]